MSEDRTDFKSAFKTMISSESPRQHPDVQTLESFHWGDLEPQQRDEVEDHLARCRDCVALLQGLDEFGGSDEQVPVPTAEAERNLAQIKHQIRAPETGPELPETVPQAAVDVPGRPRPPWFPALQMARGPYAVAASLLLATISYFGFAPGRQNPAAYDTLAARLATSEVALRAARTNLEAERSRLATVRGERDQLNEQVAFLRSDREQILQPQPNTSIVDLVASHERSTSPESQAIKIKLPSGTHWFTLLIEDPQDQIFAKYRLTIDDHQGKQLLTITNLQRTRFRNFAVALSALNLPAEELRLRLTGLTGGDELNLVEHQFQLIRE